MAPVVRFAPSPTGYLHIGNARTALYNALIARRAGGTFVLRLDDTDTERSDERFADAIAADLAWLGIPPDRTVRQSDRLSRYDAVLESLAARGLVYPCYETPEELETKRRLQRARGLPPVYDRSALSLPAAERARLEAEGRRPHYRFRLPVDPGGPPQAATRRIAWDDLCRGPLTVNLETVSDPVVRRADGTYLYMLPSVVDDMDLAVTHVIRGEDHIVNTGVQVALFEALGAAPPAFGHHNLMVRADGEALSKRSGALSLHALREAGYEAVAVASLATLIGTSLPVEPVAGVDDLAARLDLAAVSRSPARFETGELDQVNAALVHALPFEAVADRLDRHGIGGGAAFWEAIRGNLGRVDEAAGWWRIVAEDLPPGGEAGTVLVADDRAYLSAARDALPEGPLTAATFGDWTRDLKERTGRKGRSLFQPLRLALTGRPAGPELGPLLPLLGREKVARRLAAAAAVPDRSGN